MKQRQVKTLAEKFSSNGKYGDKDDLKKYCNVLLEGLKFYTKALEKVNLPFDTAQWMVDENISYCGSFYLRAHYYNKDLDTIYRGGDAYAFNDDDEFNEVVELNQGDIHPNEKSKFQKYFVLGVSDDGWALIFHNYIKANGYDYIFRKDEILLEGNIGTYIK